MPLCLQYVVTFYGMKVGAHMEKIAYFDYCALVVLLVIFVSSVLRKIVLGKIDRWFLYIVVSCILATGFDIWAIALDNLNENINLRYFVHSGYLLFRNLFMPLTLIYVVCLTDTKHVITKYKLGVAALELPLYLFLLCIITNFKTDFLFYFDDMGHYTHGDGFIALYVLAAIYAICSFVYIVRHISYFSHRKLISLLAVYPLMIAAVVGQYMKPEFPIEMFVTSIAVLFVSAMIQRPEERLDVVTGFYKFNAYMNDMNRAFASEKPIEIIMVNITNFNAITELLGFEKLHQTLFEVAKIIRANNKKYELDAELYYIMHGKFRLVIENKHFNQTKQVAEKLSQIFKDNIVVSDMHISLSVNVCIARCPEDANEFEKLITIGAELDKMPNDNVIYDAADIINNMNYDMLKDIDYIIEDALAGGKFEVYYQPIYSVSEKKFNSAEALLRLKNEKYGFIPPDVFIPAAERNGSIHRIGDFVFEEVCKFISGEEYKKLGLDYIEVNLSVVQCMQKKMAEKIISTMGKYGVKSDQINLEITETAMSFSQNIMAENIGCLADAGIKFSLDDFGTGYSNMRRIALLPLVIVKLDKSFTTIDENPKLMIILQNTIKMLKEMNMKIVVEGIETENLVKQFTDLECEYIQGYYFSRPLPLVEFIKFVSEYKDVRGISKENN